MIAVDDLTASIDEEVRVAYPRHAVGLLRVTADTPLRPRPGAIDALAWEFRQDPEATVNATAYWRGVFASMGAKPKYGPSIEKLHGMVRNGGGALSIPLEVVRLYCWFSLVHGVPMAGYRPEHVTGTLRLAMPGGGLPFTPLGGARGGREKTKPQEVAYRDDEKAICRYWNLRDCDETKLVDGVRDAVFVFDLVDAPGMLGPHDGVVVAERFAALLDGDPAVSATVLTADRPQSALSVR